MPLFKVLVDNDVVKPEPEPVVEEIKEEEKSEEVAKPKNETAEVDAKDAAADSVTPKDDAEAEADESTNAKNDT